MFRMASDGETRVKKVAKIILTDNYQENIIELMPGLRHMGIQNILENSLQLKQGPTTSSSWIFEKMAAFRFNYFHPCTNITVSKIEEDVDERVTIGPQAKKPLEIKIPL